MNICAYVVLAHTSYEGDRVLLITADETKALKEAKSVDKYDSHNTIEKWDLVTGQLDPLYERTFWQKD